MMSIQEFETEDELEDAFEKQMEIMQEEKRLRELICEAEYRVASARDELADAESELKDLREELEELDL